MSVSAFLPVHTRNLVPFLPKRRRVWFETVSPLGGRVPCREALFRFAGRAFSASASGQEFCLRGTILEETFEILVQYVILQTGEVTSYQSCWDKEGTG